MQLDFFDIPSPCVGVCQSNEKGYCLGCMRTRDERKEWSTLNNDDKQKVIKRCIQRTKRQNKREQIKVVEVKSAIESSQPEQPSLLEPNKKVTLSNDIDVDFSDFEL
ncbi:DUF1289 domain-containing protein [Colwellia sp. MSW7]|jgi:predicted Fe-S protein YdhL (DUF1289 family)|uniref:DUF1289 domain-containing protein n=1 Tax=Colwellia maritima TaxID=2912588 RepID=A0ABS9X3E9_9GAMM|nr:DUF1289 domain-containing protein [Colwellia maritima]MCI2284758.1 DUF1289 domain-containing protein [Colwellia maritima]